MKALLLTLVGVGSWAPALPVVPVQEKAQIPADLTKRLREAKKMEIIFLDGTLAKSGTPEFHDYKIVGEPVTVKAPNDRKKIVESLVKDVAAGMGGSKSFEPSHGIRVTGEDGKVAEVILGDSWLFVFSPDGERTQFRIKNDSLKVLNAHKPK